MWNKLNNQYYISLFDGLLSEQFQQICITDFINIWFQKFTKQQFAVTAKESNIHLENISEAALLEKVTELLTKTDKVECDLVPENDFNIVKLNLKMKTQYGYPIKLKLKLSKGCTNLFFQKVTAPLFSVVKDLAASQNELFSIMAKKDKEIEEYKLEGGHLCRKYLKTPAFQESDHLSKHTTLSCVIGSLDVADYVLEKSSNSSISKRQQDNIVEINIKSETNDSKTMQEELAIKIEHLGHDITDDELDVKEDPLSPNSIDLDRTEITGSEYGPPRKKLKGFANLHDTDTTDDEDSTLLDTTINVETINNLPNKSRKQYEKQYDLFMEWKITKNITSFSEDVLLEYFEELSNKFKSASLWVHYSMIKATLNIKNQIDISKYTQLMAFLRNKSAGYKTKKSKTFSPEDIKKFINEAPDKEYFSTKIALIIGISGGCRRKELYDLKFKDVSVYKSKIVVSVITEKKHNRIFTVSGKYCELCKQYIKLRPSDCKNPQFFLKYFRGKCWNQRVGINAFGSMSKVIAEYLKLPNPELYTAQCFRRTADTLTISENITPLRQLRLDIE